MRKSRLTNLLLSLILDKGQFLTFRLTHDEIILLNRDSINTSLLFCTVSTDLPMKVHWQFIPKMVCFYLLDVFDTFWHHP